VGRVEGWHEFRKTLVMSGIKKGGYVFNWDGKARKWKV